MALNLDTEDAECFKNLLFQKEEQGLQLNISSSSIKQISGVKELINAISWNNQKYKSQIICVDSKGNFYVIDTKTNKIIQQVEATKTQLFSVDVEKSEGKRVCMGTMDNKILVFEINSKQKFTKLTGRNFNQNKPLHELQGHSGPIPCVKFLSTNYVIAGSFDSMVSIWDLENPTIAIKMHQLHGGDVLCMDVYPDNQNIFLTGSSDLSSKIWDIRVKMPVQETFYGHQSKINTVKFAPFDQPTTFATGSGDATIVIHDLRYKSKIATLSDYDIIQKRQNLDEIYSISFSPSGRLLFAGTESKDLKVWDMFGDGNVMTVIDLQLNRQNNSYNNKTKEEGYLIKNIDISCDGWGISCACCSPKNGGQLICIQ